MHVHVPKKCRVPHARTRLLATSDGCGTLCESASPWTCGKVASQRIKWLVALVRDWQGESQPLKQEHTEEAGRNCVLKCCRCVGQHYARIVARMRPQNEHGDLGNQSTLWSSWSWCQQRRMPNVASRGAVHKGHVRRSQVVACPREVMSNWVATRSPCVPTLLLLL